MVETLMFVAETQPLGVLSPASCVRRLGGRAPRRSHGWLLTKRRRASWLASAKKLWGS